MFVRVSVGDNFYKNSQIMSFLLRKWWQINLLELFDIFLNVNKKKVMFL